VQLALLVEGALRHGIRTTVALPFRDVLESEQHAEKMTVADRVERRAKAADFLKYLRFEKALRPQHLGNAVERLNLLHEYDPTSSATETGQEAKKEEVDETRPGVEEVAYRWHFPLTWLSSREPNRIHEIKNFFVNVLSERRRGADPPDADAIANVVLYELLQNVADHAGTSHALVAAWARPEKARPFARDYLEFERPHIEWMRQATGTSVELVLGDSGVGIPGKLVGPYSDARSGGVPVPKQAPSDPTNVLLWAFDRWSTSKGEDVPRGTRGLYRLDRVVCQYQGIVTARAEDQIAGWDHGGPEYDRPVFNQEELSRLPGTVIRVRMPSVHRRLAVPRLPARVPRDLVFDAVSLGPLGEGGIPDREWRRLRKKMAGDSTGRPTWLVASVEGENGDHELSNDSPKDRVEKTLRAAVELRHPGALVVAGLPGGWSLVENAVDKINDEVARDRRDDECHAEEHYEIWDPVLVVGERGKAAWAGVVGPRHAVLSALLKSQNGVLSASELETLIPDGEVRGRVLRKLRGDPSLVAIAANASLELRLTPAGIFDQVGIVVKNYVEHGRDGVLSGGIYCTPALRFVSKWLNVDTVLQRSCGYRLAATAIANTLTAHASWLKLGPADVILTDSTACVPLVKQLASALKPKRTEQLPAEVGGVPRGIVRKNDRVVVHCDILLSSESARHSLKVALRDGALAVAVTCVVDARPTRGDPEVWGVTCPVVSLCEADLQADNHAVEDARNRGEIRYINPITREIEINPVTQKVEPEIDQSELERSLYAIPAKELSSLIVKHKALHFTHIGRPIGRHFTFYLDATQLVNEPQIMGKLAPVVERWLRQPEAVPSENLPKFDIWHPWPEPKRAAPARRLAERIRDEFQNEYPEHADHPRVWPIRREAAYGRWMLTAGREEVRSNLVITDWGALTGTSILQMLRAGAEAGATRILACIFLNQLAPDEAAAIRGIRSLEVMRMVCSSSGRSYLPGFDLEQRPRWSPKNHRAEVFMQFLSELSLGCYNRHECPICRELKHIEGESYPTPLLSRFAADERSRLRQRSRDQVIDLGPGTTLDDGKLSPEAGAWMIAFRRDLEHALTSTRNREQVMGTIEAFLAKMRTHDEGPPRKALWLLSFLSVETQWFSHPPLHFSEASNMTAEIAFSVASRRNAESRDRRNALVVLRSTAPQLLAERFTELFEAALGDPSLVQHLLYDAYEHVISSKSYARSFLMRAKEQLQLVHNKIGDGKLGASAAEFQTVDYLANFAAYHYGRAEARSKTPAQRWAHLRRVFDKFCNAPHSEIPQAMKRVLPRLDRETIEATVRKREGGAPAQLPTPILEQVQTMAVYWRKCQDFLDRHVLPDIAELSDVLQSEVAREALTYRTVWRLLNMTENGRLVQGGRLSAVLKDFSANPDAILVRDNWTAYLNEVEWWHEALLRAASPNQDPSRFVMFLRQAPTDFGVVAAKEYDARQRNLPEHKFDDPDVVRKPGRLVFVPADLVREFWHEVFENLAKHTTREPGSIRVAISLKELGDRLTLRWVNDRCKKPEEAGYGLERLRNRLQPFDTELTWRLPSGAEIGSGSFKLECTFAKGE